METRGGTERIRFLAVSENRRDVLRAVCGEGPLPREAIERRLDASRRTVKRALDALAEHNYVEREEEEYRPTALGSHVCSAYASMEESLALSERLEPVLGRIPDGAFDLDPGHLAGATVRTAEEGGPYRILERVLELRREATRIRELSSVVEERSVHQLRDRLDSGADLDVEFVLTADAAERASEVETYESPHRAILESDATSGYVYDGSFPFVLGIFDETVVLGVDGGDLPHAMVESDDPDVRAWAEETFAEYRRAAEPICG